MRISDWSSDVCSSDLDDFYYRGAADRCRKSLRRPILRQSGAGIGVGVAIVDALVDRLHALQRPETRSEEHTSELQSLMRISYAVFCLKKKIKPVSTHNTRIVCTPDQSITKKIKTLQNTTSTQTIKRH